jgi:hypothetical protein
VSALVPDFVLQALVARLTSGDAAEHELGAT